MVFMYQMMAAGSGLGEDKHIARVARSSWILPVRKEVLFGDQDHCKRSLSRILPIPGSTGGSGVEMGKGQRRWGLNDTLGLKEFHDTCYDSAGGQETELALPWGWMDRNGGDSWAQKKFWLT